MRKRIRSAVTECEAYARPARTTRSLRAPRRHDFDARAFTRALYAVVKITPGPQTCSRATVGSPASDIRSPASLPAATRRNPAFTQQPSHKPFLQPSNNHTPTITQPRLNHPSCRIQERFRHNHLTFVILQLQPQNSAAELPRIKVLYTRSAV